jgi:hypothetical protein
MPEGSPPAPSPVGVWQGNVFYAYALVNNWLARAAARAEAQAVAHHSRLLAASVLAAGHDGGAG